MAGDAYHLQGLAIPEELIHLHELLDRMAAEHPDLPEDDLWLFETAVVEIADNVVEHGRPRGRVRWDFVIEVHADRLLATLSDSGEAFTGDLAGAMPDDLVDGGRGIPMARASLDQLTYDRRNGTNSWTMVKLRHPAR